MPYIAKDEREQLDNLIDALAHRIKATPTATDHEDHTAWAGRLNYVVTRLVLDLLCAPKYWKIALYCGVLSNVASEFYRKLAVPYEDKKIAENGDVYPDGR